MEYTKEIQKLFLEMMLNDAQSFVRVQNIYNVDNFEIFIKKRKELIYNKIKKYFE